MKYELQPCSPKASERINWYDCQFCNGCGWQDPMLALDKCDACDGQGRHTGVNVGIEPAPEHTGAYPFVAMLPGQCFIIQFNDGKEKTIRNRVAVRNRIDQRKWVVIKHSNFGCYEVARVK